MNFQTIAPEAHASVVGQVRQRFDRQVQLTLEAGDDFVYNPGRQAAEGACHLLLAQCARILPGAANPNELLQELMKLRKRGVIIDDAAVFLLNKLFTVGNVGSHFGNEPTAMAAAEEVREWASRLRDWLDEHFPETNECCRAGRPKGGLRFSLIRMARKSLWWPAHRLNKLPPEVDFGFHEIPGAAIEDMAFSTKSRSKDPFFDIVLEAGSKRSLVDAVGIKPLRVWSDLKGVSLPTRLRARGQYRLVLEPLQEGHEQWLDLDDPMIVPASSPWRFELQLAGFRKALPGNELMAELMVSADGQVVRSRPMYLGRY